MLCKGLSSALSGSSFLGKEPYVTVIPSCHLILAMHYDKLAANAATPYPAAPDFPLFRGENRPLYAFL